MKKLILLISVFLISACSILGNKYEYRQVEAEVNNSQLIHKVCIPENNLVGMEYYHSDIKEEGFFNAMVYKNGDISKCRYGVYETSINFNNPMNNRTIKGTVLTKERYKKGKEIPIYHRYRL